MTHTSLGLFAGIGGFELGLQRAGFEPRMLCEIDESAQRVLRTRFPDVPLRRDVSTIKRVPAVDVWSAGWPCNDLSPAGRTAGIRGPQSSLVDHVFRLLDSISERSRPTWILLENVPFMLRLDGGRAMAHITSKLAAAGYRWAYRTIDTRAFGLPHRRRRVIVVASRTEDPRVPLLDADEDEPVASDPRRSDCGFYWTEGTRGLGWAVDAIPTLKSGSGIGIPSPPAVVTPGGRIFTPDIRDAERLQGFPLYWTVPAVSQAGQRSRWRLVGNAVSVPVAEWLGRRLERAGTFKPSGRERVEAGRGWPDAAWSDGRRVYRADVGEWPASWKRRSLAQFLLYDGATLSQRAASGFLKRIEASTLSIPDHLIESIRTHVRQRTTRAA